MLPARPKRPEPLAIHLLGLVNPVATLAGILAGGWWGATGAVLTLGVYPLLDLALGSMAPGRDGQDAALRARLHAALLWVHGALHLAVITALFYRVTQDGLVPTTLVAAVSAGINGGVSALITAHEVGHRPPRSAVRRLAKLLLFLVHYSHFTTEHNHGHHRLVATAADPATARPGEGLWVFFLRTVPAQFLSAVRIDAAKGRAGWRSPVLRGFGLQLAALGLVVLVPSLLGGALDPSLALAWLVQACFAVLLLEYVNYLQHWGLVRDPSERQTAAHSWQSTACWSRWTLLELPLHPDHHLRAARPYWELEAVPGAPALPGGYYASFLPALVPALWRRRMQRALLGSGSR
ncbi:MAG: fatty acid desaturase [Planctomycetota bacterium]|nr:fatty acid desaturase [Planctomycetota bacterium]